MSAAESAAEHVASPLGAAAGPHPRGAHWVGEPLPRRRGRLFRRYARSFHVPRSKFISPLS
jgi:hypothetical protein